MEQRLPVVPVLLAAGLLAATASALDEGVAAPEGPPPLELGDDPVFSGMVRFLDTRVGDLYREGLEHLRNRRFKEALEDFSTGKRRTREKSEVEIFERLVDESAAGVQLEKIRKVSYTGGKKGARSALAALDRELAKVDKLVLAAEYRALYKELSEFLFHVIEDFETATPSSGDPDPGPGGPGAGPGGRGGGPGGQGGRGGRRGLRGLFDQAFGGGDVQTLEAGGDRDKVRQGKQSYRWPVGKDVRAELFDVDPKAVEEYGVLLLSIRGSASVKTQVEIYLLESGFEPWRLAFGRYTGFGGKIQVSGARWRDLRLEIGKDLVAKDDPDRASIGHLVLVVRDQAEQTLYLDDIKLER